MWQGQNIPSMVQIVRTLFRMRPRLRTRRRLLYWSRSHQLNCERTLNHCRRYSLRCLGSFESRCSVHPTCDSARPYTNHFAIYLLSPYEGIVDRHGLLAQSSRVGAIAGEDFRMTQKEETANHLDAQDEPGKRVGTSKRVSDRGRRRLRTMFCRIPSLHSATLPSRCDGPDR